MSSKNVLLIQETFDKVILCLGTTTVTCCDFDEASICDSWTGLCLGGPRPDVGPGGCWKSAIRASLTAQQAMRDRVTKYCHATVGQRPRNAHVTARNGCRPISKRCATGLRSTVAQRPRNTHVTVEQRRRRESSSREDREE